MTGPSRVLAVLNLYTEDRPVWHTDEINETLGYTRATGYRYIKDLVEAGLLQKVSAGRYALGARVIELDYTLRRSDPVLLAAAPVMDALARRTKLDAVLTAMYGLHMVDTHRASGDASLQLQYGRGRPRPLLQGAAAKALLCGLPRAQLARIHEHCGAEIAAQGPGATWPEFRARMAAIRKQGFYVSRGELEPQVHAAAVPLFNADGEVAAALALVGTPQAIEQAGDARLQRWLTGAAQEIGQRLQQPAAEAPPAAATSSPSRAPPAARSNASAGRTGTPPPRSPRSP